MALQVTERATEHLKQILDGTEHEDDQILRIVSDAQGNSQLVLDTQKDGDQVVEHNGKPIVVVEPVLSKGLSGTTLDVKQTPENQNQPTLTLSPSA